MEKMKLTAQKAIIYKKHYNFPEFEGFQIWNFTWLWKS